MVWFVLSLKQLILSIALKQNLNSYGMAWVVLSLKQLILSIALKQTLAVMGWLGLYYL